MAVPHKQPLNAAAITEAAVRIADADGLDGVSMRRVAAEFGVSAMALYRHVADRRTLLLLMADAAARDYELFPAPNTAWQQMLQHMADAQWRAFQAHPWLLRIILTPRRLVNVATPGEIELLLSRLRQAGLTSEQGFDCLLGVSAAVIGTASITAAALTGPERTGTERDQRWGDDAVASYPQASGFRDQGISYAASRRSLDFLVANFIAGVEQSLTHLPDSGRTPALRKEDHATAR